MVYLGVAADCEYTGNYGTAQNATQQIISNLNTASALYKSTFNVSLGIVELQVHNSTCVVLLMVYPFTQFSTCVVVPAHLTPPHPGIFRVQPMRPSMTGCLSSHNGEARRQMIVQVCGI